MIIPAVIPILLEAALRALVAAAAVWAGLRLLRVRNVPAQKAAWALVLTSALAMPLLMRCPWLPAAGSIRLPSYLRMPVAVAPTAAPAPANSSARPSLAARPAAEAEQPPPSGASRYPAPVITYSNPASGAGVDTEASPAPRTSALLATALDAERLLTFAWILYLFVGAILLLRLAFGLVSAFRLWLIARPVSISFGPTYAPHARFRSSTRISSPVNIGSGIVLPADYTEWDWEKLRIVLAHERSHVRQGDFYLQLLAGLYAAVFWFSPLGWWLKRHLSELGEAISDRAGLEEAASRSSYAQLLLEFAALPRPTLSGVAMARSGNLTLRIERLLNDSKFRQAFAAGRRRGLLAVMLVPAVLFASAVLVRVQAAGRPEPAPSAQSVVQPPNTGVSKANQVTTDEVPVPPVAPAAPLVPAPPASPVSAAPAPPISVAAPVPAVASVPALVERHLIAMVSPGAPAAVLFAPAAAAGGFQPGGPLSFERTLSFSGQLTLSVGTGSGNIHITRGSGNQLHVVGQIKVSQDGSEDEARQIAANPPISQTGNFISIGGHQEHWHGISIDYEIQAPADTILSASSGSGNVIDSGVGQNAKLNTGSGDVNATGLQGGFKVETGSGNIVAEGTGEGDAKVETGSGNIEVKDVRGALIAETGSGDIKATGTPSSAWKLQTGSGNIELWPGNAGLTFDASTGSGNITSDREMMMQGALNRHHITGTINGGGQTIRLETGSGNIHIH